MSIISMLKCISFSEMLHSFQCFSAQCFLKTNLPWHAKEIYFIASGVCCDLWVGLESDFSACYKPFVSQSENVAPSPKK